MPNSDMIVRMSKISHQTTLTIIRLLFGLVLGIEFANIIGLVNFSDLPIWPGLFGTAGAVWAGLEYWRYYTLKNNLQFLPSWILFISLGAVLLDAAGNLTNWYFSTWYFDNIVHFLSGAIATLVMFFVFYSIHSSSLPFSWIAYITFGTTTILGVAFEVVEYLANIFHDTDIWLGSGPDTVMDLVMSSTGALLVIIFLSIFWQRTQGKSFTS